MDESIPLYEVLFEIVYNLCKQFPALSPFEVEDRPFHDVIVLYCDLLKARKREATLANPDRVIRKQAGDDWF